MSTAAEAVSPKADEILDVAESLIQTRGYNAFSFRDIARAVGIKSASVHYHFPTKGDLGRAVAARYRGRFDSALAALERRERSARALLDGYAGLYRATLAEQDRACLCGMLAGEVETVPPEVRDEVGGFFRAQHAWLADVIARGVADAQIPAGRDSVAWATTLLATLEGAMLVARGLGDIAAFDTAAAQVLGALAGDAPG